MSRPDGYLVNEPDVDSILYEIARGFRVTVDDILGDSRIRRFTVARACAMAVIRESTTLSLPAIGQIFDRDHTTVMHHVQRVMSDPDLSRSVRLVVDELSPPPQLFAEKEEKEGS